MSDETVTLTASCLCKAHMHSITIPKSNLPLQAHICHCDTCRHISGSLYTSLAYLPVPRSTVDLSDYKSYNFSPPFDVLFCSTCSTPMFGAFKDETRQLLVATGTLSNIACEAEVMSWAPMCYVGDTTDGGASQWLKTTNVSGPPVKCFKYNMRGDGAEELPDDWQLQPPTQEVNERQDTVPIRCKCQGVHFILHRNNYSGVKDEDLGWNVDPTTRKIKAEFCGCDSCRLQTGTDVCYWAFSDLKNISFPANTDKAEFPSHMDGLSALVDERDPRIGSLTYYQSSPGVHRYFCGTCSATIFYAIKKRPHVIDIAVGLLEAKDGARAESMLAWAFEQGVGSKEDAKGGWREGFFERIEKAVMEYSRTRKVSG